MRGKLKLAALRGKTVYDQSRKVEERSFVSGNRVYYRTSSSSKLNPIWTGPYVVVEQSSETNYVIQGDSSVRKDVHVNYLKTCHDGEASLGVLRGRGRPRLNA